MIHHMDEGIGWVLDALERAGAADDTLVVFTSDNGGERFSDNWPLVGGKMDLPRAASACPRSRTGRRACRRAGPPRSSRSRWTGPRRSSNAAGVDAAPGLSARRHRSPRGRKAAESLLADEVPRAEGGARGELEIPLDRGQRVPVRPGARSARAGEHATPGAGAPRAHEGRILEVGSGSAADPAGREGVDWCTARPKWRSRS